MSKKTKLFQHSPKFFLLLSICSLCLAQTEEEKVSKISRILKPISDEKWNEMTSSGRPEIYEIQKGDTLWSVSERLFGNANYWPKVWSINNSSLGNPHILQPGAKLVFNPGSANSLPSLNTSIANNSVASTESNSSTNSLSGTKKEYEKLDPEKWKPQDIERLAKLKDLYDNYGFDKNLKVHVPSRFSFRVPAIANDAKIPHLAEIVASRREGVGLSTGDTVFIRSNNLELQVGTTYGIMTDPVNIKEKKSDRSAYIYESLGEVKIIGIKDQLFVGVLEKSYDVVKRGDRIFPLLPLINDIKPVAATKPVESVVFFNHEHRPANTSQFQFIHFDRGIEDGVHVGNVFRVYEYFDPATTQRITDSDFIVNSDAIVVHATAEFSTALVIRSRDTFTRGNFGILLTDISDLERKRNRTSDSELEELNRLDEQTGEGLGRQEETEIKELQEWDRTKDSGLKPDSNLEQMPEGNPQDTLQFEDTYPDGADPTIPDANADDELILQNTPNSKDVVQPDLPGTGDTPPVEGLEQAPTEDIELQWFGAALQSFLRSGTG